MKQAFDVWDKILALLSYLSILFIIPLFFIYKRDYVHQHFKQGVIFFLSSHITIFFAFWIPFWTLDVGSFVEILTWILFTLVLTAFVNHLVFLVYEIYVIFKKEGFWKIPLLGTLGNKLP